jgi:hypothetical protein
MQLLPNAKQQFIDQNGLPLASGSVGFYYPGTLNPKATFQDPAGTIANTNPVLLDSRGQALIWGSGVYRQIVKDASGVTIWDQITEDSNAGLTGNITDAKYASGVDFVPGVTTSLTLPVAPGATQNIWVFFDAGFQADDQYSVSGTMLTFTAPIPVGVQEVNVKIGTTIAVGVPSDGAVGDKQLAWGSTLDRSVDSVAALRALQSSRYTRVHTKGYATVGDGGEGEYWLDTSVSSFTLATPSNVSLTAAISGGYLTAGSYGYRVAAIDESGTTAASATSSISTTGTTSAVTVSWNAVAGAAGYIIYGRTAGSEQELVRVSSSYTTWVDTGGITNGLGFPRAGSWQWDNGGSRIQASDGGRYRLLVAGGRYNIEQFGAKADGATDNTAAINSAIIAAWCNGGGEILFRAGVYMSGQIVMQTNVHLRGIGTDHSGHFQSPSFSNTLGTTLRQLSGINPGNGFLFVPLYVHSNRITSINVDGNAGGNPTQGATIYVAPGFPDSDFSNQSEDLYFTLRDCGVMGGTTFGVYAGAAGRGGRILNSYIYSNPGDGVRIQTSDWTISETLFGVNGNNLVFLGANACHVTGCDIFTPQETTIGSTGSNVIINDSSFFSGPVPCDGIWFTSCEFDYAAEHGVAIYGTNTTGIVFQGCRWNSSSINHDNQYSHIAIGANVMSGGVTLANCEFDVGAPPNLAQYDILFADTAKWIRVSNNLHLSGSNRTGVSNSLASLRMGPGSADSTCFMDGAGRVFGSQLRVNSQTDIYQSQIANFSAVENTNVLEVLGGSASSLSIRTVNTGGYAPGACAVYVGKNTSTSRSLNAGGTINANGADYAEYELKRADCGAIAKGQIVGFDEHGKLTDKFALAIRFGIKSTAPNLVGGDDWHLAAGDAPVAPIKPADIGSPPTLAVSSHMGTEQRALADSEYRAAMSEWIAKNASYSAVIAQYDIDLAAYKEAYAAYEAKVEELRATVDRIAYCGKVPVNVTGAKPGQYLVPVQSTDGGIEGSLVDQSAITFDQYKIAVGCVSRVREDGRAEVVVKVS